MASAGAAAAAASSGPASAAATAAYPFPPPRVGAALMMPPSAPSSPTASELGLAALHPHPPLSSILLTAVPPSSAAAANGNGSDLKPHSTLHSPAQAVATRSPYVPLRTALNSSGSGALSAGKPGVTTQLVNALTLSKRDAAQAASDGRALARERDTLDARVTALTERVREVTRVNDALDRQNVHFRAALQSLKLEKAKTDEQLNAKSESLAKLEARIKYGRESQVLVDKLSALTIRFRKTRLEREEYKRAWERAERHMTDQNRQIDRLVRAAGARATAIAEATAADGGNAGVGGAVTRESVLSLLNEKAALEQAAADTAAAEHDARAKLMAELVACNDALRAERAEHATQRMAWEDHSTSVQNALDDARAAAAADTKKVNDVVGQQRVLLDHIDQLKAQLTAVTQQRDDTAAAYRQRLQTADEEMAKLRREADAARLAMANAQRDIAQLKRERADADAAHAAALTAQAAASHKAQQEVAAAANDAISKWAHEHERVDGARRELQAAYDALSARAAGAATERDAERTAERLAHAALEQHSEQQSAVIDQLTRQIEQLQSQRQQPLTLQPVVLAQQQQPVPSQFALPPAPTTSRSEANASSNGAGAASMPAAVPVATGAAGAPTLVSAAVGGATSGSATGSSSSSSSSDASYLPLTAALTAHYAANQQQLQTPVQQPPSIVQALRPPPSAQPFLAVPSAAPGAAAAVPAPFQTPQPAPTVSAAAPAAAFNATTVPLTAPVTRTRPGHVVVETAAEAAAAQRTATLNAQLSRAAQVAASPRAAAPPASQTVASGGAAAVAPNPVLAAVAAAADAVAAAIPSGSSSSSGAAAPPAPGSAPALSVVPEVGAPDIVAPAAPLVAAAGAPTPRPSVMLVHAPSTTPRYGSGPALGLPNAEPTPRAGAHGSLAPTPRAVLGTTTAFALPPSGAAAAAAPRAAVAAAGPSSARPSVVLIHPPTPLPAAAATAGVGATDASASTAAAAGGSSPTLAELAAAPLLSASADAATLRAATVPAAATVAGNAKAVPATPYGALPAAAAPATVGRGTTPRAAVIAASAGDDDIKVADADAEHVADDGGAAVVLADGTHTVIPAAAAGATTSGSLTVHSANPNGARDGAAAPGMNVTWSGVGMDIDIVYAARHNNGSGGSAAPTVVVSPARVIGETPRTASAQKLSGPATGVISSALRRELFPAGAAAAGAVLSSPLQPPLRVNAAHQPLSPAQRLLAASTPASTTSAGGGGSALSHAAREWRSIAAARHSQF